MAVHKNIYRTIPDGLFFALFFLYFLIFNRYHLIYHEQIQLFIFDLYYPADFFSRPGGLSELAGSFLTQFFLFPTVAASILTMAAFFIFRISRHILKYYNLQGAFWSYIPVFLLAALHSSHLYTITFTSALILSLLFFTVCMNIKETKKRTAFLVLLWPVLYIVSGGYSIIAILMCFIHEIFITKTKSGLFISIFILAFGATVPLILSETLFYMKKGTEWTSLLPLFIPSPYRYILLLCLFYFPFIMVMARLRDYLKIRAAEYAWNYKSIVAGILVFSMASLAVYKYFYDSKTETLLGMDAAVQNSNWNKVLDLSSSLNSSANRMTMYFTNLSLCKSGTMGEKLFSYPQSGPDGLWLDWKQDWLTAFFGNEIYYQLSYISEAKRWAFEAMVAKGPNPRSLKRLALTSLIDGNTAEAKKYLDKLHSTLFYRRWSEKYIRYTENPELVEKDKELSEKRRLSPISDFINSENIGSRLPELLSQHPENKMAFEYLMASKLLRKDLDGFEANIYRIKELGYRKIPPLYEEALLACMSRSGKDIIPEGYSISEATRKRLNEYAKAIYSYNNNGNLAAQEMNGRFGNCYWYYLKFISIQ